MSPKAATHILIIEDDRQTSRMLSEALSRQGFSVTVERDGEWGVRAFQKRQFDVVLLDLLLPAMSGYEVAKKLKATPRGRRVPIIMMSGVYKTPVQQTEAVESYGAFAFLEKPITLAKLTATLRDALGDGFPTPDAIRPPPPPVDDDEDTNTGETLADPSAKAEASAVEAHSVRNDAGHVQMMRGDFSHTSFAEVLAEVHRWKGTGALLLRRKQTKKIVYFRNGAPLSVKSNLLSECLGRLLVKEKMISEAECEESLKRMKASKRQQGTVLIEMGCLSPHNLKHGLELQLRTKLYEMFSWDDGDYHFTPKVAAPAETVALGMTTAEAIYSGIKSAYDEARLERAFHNVSSKFVHLSPNPLFAFQDAGLDEDERQLLEAVDGHRTVSTLRALAILPRFETDRLLFAMRCAQVIELKDRPSEQRGSRLTSLPSFRPPPLPPKAAAAEAPSVRVQTTAPEQWGPRPPPFNKQNKGPVAAKSEASLLPELSHVVSLKNVSDEDRKERERLAALVSDLRKKDFFGVLGLATNAAREDVKRAYFALAKEYHPDRHFGSSSAEVRQLAQQAYDIISQAHDTLADPVERERYLKERLKRPVQQSGDDVGKILAAEGKFQRGEALMREREYAMAFQAFREAIELYAEEGEFHAWLGWSRFQKNPKDEETADLALRDLEHAVSLNPKLDRSYLFQGYIFKATGRPDRAEKQFEKAIQCNPDCTEALRELRLFGSKAKR